MGPRSRHTALGDVFCLLEMNVLWCEKCKSIWEQQQRLCEDDGGNRYKSIYIHSKTRPNLKGCSARKKPLLQNRRKKPDYGWQLHMGTNIILFGEMSSGLMKQKYNCLAIMTIVMFKGKRGRLVSRRTPSQLWSMGVAASCWGGALLQEGLVHLTK